MRNLVGYVVVLTGIVDSVLKIQGNLVTGLKKIYAALAPHQLQKQLSMDPKVRAFVDIEKQKMLKNKFPPLTIEDIIKHHNHEIWRVCYDCLHHFDLKKEVEIDKCPRCGSENIRLAYDL